MTPTDRVPDVRRSLFGKIIEACESHEELVELRGMVAADSFLRPRDLTYLRSSLKAWPTPSRGRSTRRSALDHGVLVPERADRLARPLPYLSKLRMIAAIRG